MRLINPQVEIIKQSSGVEGIFKQIEIAGRTCYKSQDKITEDSSEKFVDKLIKSHHTAMLEHGTMYLNIPLGTLGDDPHYMWKSDIIQIFKKNPYSRVNKYRKRLEVFNTEIGIDFYAITTNYRVFEEQIDWNKLGPMRYDKMDGWELGLDKEYVLSFLCEPTEHHEKRYSFKIICDRGVTHELVRHKLFCAA